VTDARGELGEPAAPAAPPAPPAPEPPHTPAAALGPQATSASFVRCAPVPDPLVPVVSSVSPEPEPDVMAAIVAAVEQCWPRPVEGAAEPPAVPVWRFSGRWWAKPTALRRERPWIGGAR
jgi:hypothetical protein